MQILAPFLKFKTSAPFPGSAKFECAFAPFVGQTARAGHPRHRATPGGGDDGQCGRGRGASNMPGNGGAKFKFQTNGPFWDRGTTRKWKGRKNQNICTNDHEQSAIIENLAYEAFLHLEIRLLRP